MSERELWLRLEDKIQEFAKELLKGNHIEIHLSKDGIKFFSVGKKIVK